MEKRNVCDIGEILQHAETMGYNWNQVGDILYDANLYQDNVYIEDIVWGAEDRDFTDAENIIVSFAMKHGVDEFYIEPK